MNRKGPGKRLVLDPRTKFLIWICANIVVFSNSPRVFFTAVMALYAVLFLLSGRARSMLKLLAGYAMILYLQYRVLPSLPGGVATIFATFTYAALVFPCVMGGMYLIMTTSVSQLIAAFRRIHVPENLTIAMAVTLRYLPSLREEIHHVLDAMRLRRLRRPEQWLEGFYVPVLMSTAQTAEELSESAAARGIENPGPKTTWHTIGFHIQDILAIVVFAGVCAAAIYCKGTAG